MEFEPSSQCHRIYRFEHSDLGGPDASSRTPEKEEKARLRVEEEKEAGSVCQGVSELTGDQVPRK
jgi:hypothetical protein